MKSSSLRLYCRHFSPLSSSPHQRSLVHTHVKTNSPIVTKKNNTRIDIFKMAKYLRKRRKRPVVHSDFIDKFCSLQIVKYLQESSMHLQSKWFECKCWKLIDLPGISWAWCTSEGTTCNFSQVQARDHTERDFLCYKHISKMVKKECVMFLYVA